MHTGSYPHQITDSEPPVLTMNWVSDDGVHLRSRWSVEAQTRHVNSAWLDCAPSVTSLTPNAAIFKAQGFSIFHLLCRLLILFI